jgi:hypothetical protein
MSTHMSDRRVEQEEGGDKPSSLSAKCRDAAGGRKVSARLFLGTPRNDKDNSVRQELQNHRSKKQLNDDNLPGPYEHCHVQRYRPGKCFSLTLA